MSDINLYDLIPALGLEDWPYTEYTWVTAIEDIEGTDPEPGLMALALVRTRLSGYHEYLEERESDLVLKAQVEMRPWSLIGEWLGVSRQAAWKKHRDPGEPLPSDQDDHYTL